MTTFFLNIHPSPSATKRLICFHHAGGAASSFRAWSKYFDSSTEILAVQLPGRENRYNERAQTNLASIVRQLAIDIRPYTNKPYYIFGHSLGALLSYELLQLLQLYKIKLPCLFMPSGHRAPKLPRRSPDMYGLSHDRFVERLADYEGTPTEVLENTSLLEILVPLMRADFELADTYIFNQNKPKLNCPIHAFGGTDDGLVNIDELDSWKEMSAFDSSFSLIKGGHFFIKSAEEELIQLIKKNILKSENQISFNYLA